MRSKKQVAKISIFIIGIFIISLSVTYAFVTQVIMGEKKQVITAGVLSLSFTNEVSLNLTNAYPTADEVGMIGEYASFDLVNNTSNNTNYQLFLKDVTTSSEKLDYDLVKVYVEKNDNTKLIKRLSSISYNDMTIDSGVIAGNATNHYKFRLWIDEGVEDENLIFGKTLSLKVGVKIAQDDKELAKVDNYPKPSMELITKSASMGSNNLAEYKMKLTNVSDETLTFKPIIENDNFEIVKSDGGEIDSITLAPYEVLEYTYYVKTKNEGLIGSNNSIINIEMESPYHETIITDDFITTYIGMESWLKTNGATTLSSAILMSDNMNPNVENAKQEIANKPVQKYDVISPTVTYDKRVIDANAIFSTTNQIYMSTEANLDPKTGNFSLVNPIKSFIINDYTNYYTCNRIDTNSCSTVYQIKSFTTGTSGGTTNYKVTAISYRPYAKTNISDTSGLYKTMDDYGDTFYYRGRIENNYVKFGSYIKVGSKYYSNLSNCVAGGNTEATCNSNTKDMYWRIVRINGDRSVRVIYAGESPDASGNNQSISLVDSASRTSAFNFVTYDPTYVGYTYGKNFVEKKSSKAGFTNISQYYKYYFYKEPPVYNSSTETYEFPSDAESFNGTWFENTANIIANYPYTCWSTGKTCNKGFPYFEIVEYKNNPVQAYGYYHSVSSSDYNSTISNEYDSTIKTRIDKWYEAVFMDNNGNYKTDSNGKSMKGYFSDTLFCNDRSIKSGNGFDFVPGTIYNGYDRLYFNKSPSLKCTNKNDRYTVSDTTIGNGWLKYPIGLITVDEASLAGGRQDYVNTEYYLYSGVGYRTLSPTNFSPTNLISNIWIVASNGFLSQWNSVASGFGVRTVLNLSSDVMFEGGDGTADHPYEIMIK